MLCLLYHNRVVAVVNHGLLRLSWDEWSIEEELWLDGRNRWCSGSGRRSRCWSIAIGSNLDQRFCQNSHVFPYHSRRIVLLVLERLVFSSQAAMQELLDVPVVGQTILHLAESVSFIGEHDVGHWDLVLLQSGDELV